MDVNALLREAKVRSKTMKVDAKDKLSGFLKDAEDLDKTYSKNLANVLKTYASDKTELKTDYLAKTETDFNSRLATLKADESDITALLRTVDAETASLRALMEKGDQLSTDLNYTLNNLKNTNFKELDATSRRLLMDFNDTHRQANVVRWLKLAIAGCLLVYLRDKWKLFIVIYALVYVVWYVYKGIRGFIALMRTKKNEKLLGPVLCADNVTPSNETGSNCKAFEKVYEPCNTSPFGCTRDGFPKPSPNFKEDERKCWSEPLGCCADGSVNNGNCATVVACGTTTFGCCENESAKKDKEGSNCDMQSPCGRTAFGCSPNGTPVSRDPGKNDPKKETPPEPKNGWNFDFLKINNDIIKN